MTLACLGANEAVVLQSTLVFKSKLNPFLVCGLLLVGGAASASVPFELETVRVTDASSALQAHADRGFSGAVRVVRDGKMVFEGAVGLRDYADPERGAIEFTDRFPIGSVSKQFTAAAVLRLEEQGLLSIEDRLDRYFPDLSWSGAVTLKQLLNHTAGAPNYTELMPIQQMVARTWTPLELFELFRGKPLDFEPGSKWNYSNTGYFLLGEVVRKLTGKSWHEYLRDEFFLPLGMDDTSAMDEVVLPSGLKGFDINDRFEPAPTSTRYLSWAHAAGALVSTVEDLARWNEALHGGRVLSPPQYAAMIEAGLESYGLGLIHSQTPMGDGSVEVIGHSGGLPGFYSKNYFYPEQRLQVIVLSNLTNEEDAGLAATLSQVVLTGAAEVLRVPVCVAIEAEFQLQVSGTYQFKEFPARAWIHVTDLGELWLQVEGQGRFLLKRVAQDVLYLRFDDVVIQLERNAVGDITGFELNQRGQQFHAERVLEQ